MVCLRIVAVILFWLILIGQSSAENFLTDIRITDMSITDWEGIEKFEGMKRAADPIRELDHEKFVIVTLATRTNLSNLEKDGWYILPESHFCKHPKTVALLSTPEFFIDKMNLSRKSAELDRAISGDNTDVRIPLSPFLQNGLYHYQVIVGLQWEVETPLPRSLRKDKNQKFFFRYDLIEKPMDICMYLESTKGFRNRKSKMLVVDKDKIQSLIVSSGLN